MSQLFSTEGKVLILSHDYNVQPGEETGRTQTVLVRPAE